MYDESGTLTMRSQVPIDLEKDRDPHCVTVEHGFGYADSSDDETYEGGLQCNIGLYRGVGRKRN